MKLLTKKLINTLPQLYAQEKLGNDAIIYAKFFTPFSDWTWYATEASAVVEFKDGETVEYGLREVSDKLWAMRESGEFYGDMRIVDVTFFGLVQGFEEELGYFSLAEMESVHGPGGLTIERDMYWTPRKISEVML